MTLVGYLLAFIGVLAASYGAGTILAETAGWADPKARAALLTDVEIRDNRIRLFQRCNRFMGIGSMVLVIGLVLIFRTHVDWLGLT